MATVTIKNLDRLSKKLDKLSKLNIEKNMTKAVSLVHAQAKGLAPVDYGFLKGSIHMSVKKNSNEVIGKVYTNSEYASFVEFGTGVKGKGTYPYSIPNLNLSYKSEPWLYYNERWNKWVCTHGQVAQPFMYKALHLHEETIKKLLKQDIKTSLNKICNGGK